MWDHIIKNGILVTGEGSEKADIYVKDQKIAKVVKRGDSEGASLAEALDAETLEITDAQGKYVLPGLIDTHVHSRDGRIGAHHKEDFSFSTKAAAAGGITTIFEMPNCNPTIYSEENLRSLVEIVEPKAHVDFGVWGLCLGDLNKEEIPKLDKAGVIGYKFFWGYAIDSKAYQLIYNYEPGMEGVIPPLDNGEVMKIFRDVAKTGKKVAIHAEDFFIIKALTEEVRKRGEDSYAALLESRPVYAETIVIDTAIKIAEATGAHLHILHVGCGDGVDIIRDAKKHGVDVTCETCPHYLYLTDEDAKDAGTKMKTYPLIRTREDRERVWEGLRDGTISTVASDHAPHTEEEKANGFWGAPAGISGTETMSQILLDGVSKGKITINDVARVLSENPAKLYGLYPMKGSFDIGSDADFAIVDMDMEYVFNQEDMHSKIKMSPYDGRKFKGKVIETILRGKTIARDGIIEGEPEGKYIKA